MTANLPDNVTAVTEYTVRSTGAQGFSEIYVNRPEGYDGGLKLKQDGDSVLIDPADVPGLIAALQAAAGVTAPQDPAFVIDNEGDRWDYIGNGMYRVRGYGDVAERTLDDVRTAYGIRETA